MSFPERLVPLDEIDLDQLDDDLAPARDRQPVQRVGFAVFLLPSRRAIDVTVKQLPPPTHLPPSSGSVDQAVPPGSQRSPRTSFRSLRALARQRCFALRVFCFVARFSLPQRARAAAG